MKTFFRQGLFHKSKGKEKGQPQSSALGSDQEHHPVQDPTGLHHVVMTDTLEAPSCSYSPISGDLPSTEALVTESLADHPSVNHLPSATKNWASLDDCPQEILDQILWFHTPCFSATSEWDIAESVRNFDNTISWLCDLALLSWRWNHAISPLLLSTVLVSVEIPLRKKLANRDQVDETHFHAQVEAVKRHSQSIRHLVLNCRVFRTDPEERRAEILNGFQECLAACTEIQVLDVISLHGILPQVSPLPQTLVAGLFPHISSIHLHSLAIRTEPNDLCPYNAIPIYILNSLSSEVSRRITQLDLQSWHGPLGMWNLSTFQVTLPSLRTLHLSLIQPDAFSNAISVITTLTRSHNESTSISELSLTRGFIQLSNLVALLRINNIGQNLLHLHLQFRWRYPESEPEHAPGVIFAACPQIRHFLFFVPCPITILSAIPPNLVELGLLIYKDVRVNLIYQMVPIVNWSNDPARRRNVKKLLLHWALGVENQKKMRDKKTLKSCNPVLDVEYVEFMW
ncbi:hypothetical protein BDN72DRAFT_834193 [Pluteus cervinus]|uniref:Uncharacterized protein n=1 Tax=Pluteus cervinus TaxID=181527 RepID=A0ACD3B6U5_9AGAR|nr:hypothetical protein BDN72DRAFT_834193 [Pluteus cervinus]